MNIIIRGKNIEITNALREYVEKRIGKLDKYFEGLDEAQVTLTVERDRHRIEATIPVNGMILRGEEETLDMYSSIDMVIDKLEKQIAKHKTRLSRKVKNGSLLDLVPKQNNGYADELEPQILRTKRFAIKPMPVDEAIMQMNLIGHNFYVFSNAETEEVNVVYKRKDGHYGLIEPEF
ncbi:MAG: ribosome-associated translation inhibitor RaiA [Clostridia bacterium]|nr:ribosome-associated translation inhibitor RaiA [Clostridia bacterium]